jgi:PAS domain S-box-containing protein
MQKAKELFDLPFLSQPGIVGISTLNDGRYLYVNQNFTLVLGWSREEVLGKTSKELGIFDNYSQRGEMLAIIQSQGSIQNLEVRIRTKNGSVRIGLFSAEIITLDGQQCLVAQINDITDRKLAEESLKESEMRFRNVFDNAPIGIALVGAGFHFQKCNQAMCDFTGYTVKELLALTFPDITHPDHLAGDLDAISRLRSGQFPLYKTEKKYLHKNGSFIWGEAHISVIRGIDGEFLYFLAMVKDITDQKVAESEIQRIHDDLKASNAAKDKFFSILAHDLKNPFNSILGFCELLQSEARSLDIDAIERYIGIVHTSSRQTYELLEKVLAWAQIQPGKVVFSPRLIMLHQMIVEQFNLTEAVAAKKGITLWNEVPVEFACMADENMLSPTLRNLISNAVKFTGKNGVVRISAQQTADHVVISVIDSGVGMTPEVVSLLFRIETSFTTNGTEKEKGTGLGLLLCKEFVEIHGGKISVESEPGKGSIFRVTLPVNP